MNIVVTKFYYRSNPVDNHGVSIRDYRQRMYREWVERGLFEATEQKVCDQAKAIKRMDGCD